MSQSNEQRTAIHHHETHELLGFVAFKNGAWQAQTVFSYPIARTENEAEAKQIVQTQGLSFLMGVWRYYDKQANDWFACILQEVNEQRVTVVRTNDMGYQDPEHYKRVTLLHPDESVLVKSY